MGRRFTCGTEAKFIWPRGCQVKPRCSAALARRDNRLKTGAPFSPPLARRRERQASADAATDFRTSTVGTRRRLDAIVSRSYLKYRWQNVLHAQLQPFFAEAKM